MNNVPDQEKLRRAIDIIKQALGPQEAARIEQKLATDSGSFGLSPTLSKKDLSIVLPVLDNPEILRRILSSPQGREGLKKILDQKL